MKMSSFFNLATDLNDLLDFFYEVESREQLVSRLERLKRQPGELLATIQGGRGSIVSAMNDTLEMNSSFEEPEIESDPELDAQLDALVAEKPNSEEPSPTENTKKDDASPS